MIAGLALFFAVVGGFFGCFAWLVCEGYVHIQARPNSVVFDPDGNFTDSRWVWRADQYEIFSTRWIKPQSFSIYLGGQELFHVRFNGVELTMEEQDVLIAAAQSCKEDFLAVRLSIMLKYDVRDEVRKILATPRGEVKSIPSYRMRVQIFNPDNPYEQRIDRLFRGRRLSPIWAVLRYQSFNEFQKGLESGPLPRPSKTAPLERAEDMPEYPSVDMPELDDKIVPVPEMIPVREEVQPK